MKTYRIHIVTMRGKLIFSDPIDVGQLDREEIVSHLNDTMTAVGNGGYIKMEVNGIERTYLNHAIESIYWTDGS